MKTVKEVAKLTGVSVRALHYYDQIGLLKPSKVSEAGYRLYDGAAVEKLRRILFFREFGVPLKEIGGLLEAEKADRERILAAQKDTLLRRKKQLERLMAQIDNALRGEKNMTYEAFTQEDVEELFHTFMEHAPEEIIDAGIREFGSMEAYRENYVAKALQLYNQPQTQEILMESYGDKQTLKDAASHPIGEEGVKEYQRKIDELQCQLAQCKREGKKSGTLEATVLIGEYAAATKKVFALKEERHLMLSMADTWEKYEAMAQALDRQYQEPGVARYLAEGIRYFYR